MNVENNDNEEQFYDEVSIPDDDASFISEDEEDFSKGDQVIFQSWEEFLANYEQRKKNQTLAEIKRFTLKLSYCELGDEEVQVLASALTFYNSLMMIDLDFWGNSISDQGLYPLLEAISKMGALEELYLRLTANKITGKGTSKIKEVLFRFNKLKTLHLWLGWNPIGKEGILNISDLISQMKGLNNLDLRICGVEMDEQDSEILAKGISNIGVMPFLKISLIDLLVGYESLLVLCFAFAKVLCTKSLQFHLHSNLVPFKKEEVLKKHRNKIMDYMMLKRSLLLNFKAIKGSKSFSDWKVRKEIKQQVFEKFYL